MSKRKLVTKKLIKGKFYLVHDGSKNGHPGMIYWKNDRKNLYLSITTGSTYTKALIKLNRPTFSNKTTSYANKKPFLGKRKDYGSNILVGMKFSKKDKKNKLREISIKIPRYSQSINRKDRRYFIKVRNKKAPKY